MEEERSTARLGTNETQKVHLGLALTGLVILAFAGAAVQLVRGERPVLLPA
jgi:hypothetical protein